MITHKLIRRSILLCAVLVCAGCACAQNPPEYTAEEQALREDIGQMLLVGFRGTQLSDTNHIVRDIKEYHIGGVILFEYDVPSQSRPRNITSPKQLKQLCQALQKLSEDTLLIGIDQEGGYVTRLKPKQGFPAFKSAQQSANEGDGSVRRQAQLTATTLAGLGINLDFAPCVDVNINPQCPIIGKLERSFSSNPDRVTACARIWVNALQKQGVTACLKHFPGHGSSQSDTHLGMADVSDTWVADELKPYQTLIAEGNIRMVMTTHVFNAQLDSLYPATLSPRTLTGLLRDSLHFEGVIITDDLAMGAMTQQYNYKEMLQRTILAGADMLCLSNNGQDYNPDIVPLTVDLIFQLVKAGKIPAERIHESAERIRKLMR